MTGFDRLKSVARLRGGLLAHVENMFVVIEELDGVRGRVRTRSLSDDSWLDIKRAYDGLGRDLMMLLAVAEVGSPGDEGYLYNTRIDRYRSANQALLKWVAGNQALPDAEVQPALRKYLVSHGATLSECVHRIVGLAHSYSTDIDRDIEQYRKSVRSALELSSSAGFGGFVTGLARVKKLTYALRWCDALSGDLQKDGSGKSLEGLERLIRLLWLATRPVSVCPGNRVFEIRFPSTVPAEAVARLAECMDKLDAGVHPGDFDVDQVGSAWAPAGGVQIRTAHSDRQEVVLDFKMAWAPDK